MYKFIKSIKVKNYEPVSSQKNVSLFHLFAHNMVGPSLIHKGQLNELHNFDIKSLTYRLT